MLWYAEIGVYDNKIVIYMRVDLINKEQGLFNNLNSLTNYHA